MLSFAILQRISGRFGALRKIVGHLCRARLRIVRNRPCSEEAYAHREAVLDACIPVGQMVSPSREFVPKSVTAHIRRKSHTSLFNGDLRDEIWIWHHVGVDCTSTDEELKDMFEESAPLVLLPNMVDYFPRHRWTGAADVMRSLALFANTNNLLVQSVRAWLGSDGAAAQVQFGCDVPLVVATLRSIRYGMVPFGSKHDSDVFLVSI
jgi:hypothetical protein